MANNPTPPKKISVIMSAYNAADHVQKSVRSILDQTFGDFEFIIIDDGSTDETPHILKKMAALDARIRIITHENKGLTKSLNIGIENAKGTLIARQDTDDYALPDRFKIQIKHFETHKDLLLLGGNAINEYADGSTGEWGYHDDENISKIVQLHTPFAHSTVMMRARAVKALGGYDESYVTSQDTELWMRFATLGRISMTKEPLIRRSVHEGSISSKRKWRQFCDVLRARLIHYQGSKLYAFYFSLRGLILASLPQGLIRFLKGLLGRS